MNAAGPGFVRSTAMMAGLYARTLLRGRKTWLVGVLFLLGISLAVSVGALEGERRIQGYQQLLAQMTLGFAAQFAALFYGTAVVREEVEAGTLPYLFVRPLPRASIVLGRWLTALLVVLVVLVGFAALAHLLAAPPEAAPSATTPMDVLELIARAVIPGMPSELETPSLARVVLAAGLCAAYYTTVFTAFAVLLPKPFLFGLGYIIFWEFALPLVPNAVATLSLKFHALNIAGLEQVGSLPLFKPAEVSVTTSVAVFAIATTVFLIISLWAFPRREYNAAA